MNEKDVQLMKLRSARDMGFRLLGKAFRDTLAYAQIERKIKELEGKVGSGSN